MCTKRLLGYWSSLHDRGDSGSSLGSSNSAWLWPWNSQTPDIWESSGVHIRMNPCPIPGSWQEGRITCGSDSDVVHGVARSRLSDFTFTFCFHALEKEMATHSSVLAWRIPGTAEPGGLPSMGSHRVGHDWSDLAAADSDVSLQEDFQIPGRRGRDTGAVHLIRNKRNLSRGKHLKSVSRGRGA